MGVGRGVGASVGMGVLVGVGERVRVGTAVGVDGGLWVARGAVAIAVLTVPRAGWVVEKGEDTAVPNSLFCPQPATLPNKKKASKKLAEKFNNEMGFPGIFSSRRKI